MSVSEYQSYAQYLELLISSTVARRHSVFSPDLKAVDAALDGQASRELRRLVPLDARRASGAFFTGSELAAKALRPLGGSVNAKSIIYDAACGAGDLLIAAANYLPVEKSLRRTLERWNEQIYGRDLHAEFINAAKARLILAAMRRTCDFDLTPDDRLDPFPNVRVGCGLSDERIKVATHIVINPPFTLANAPAECDWGGGKINSAAVFVLSCLRRAAEGARLIAILPDVLRSGSRYKHWRERVEKISAIESVMLHGQFDQLADVDVFLLNAVRSSRSRSVGTAWQGAVSTGATVGNNANVSVGPVVNFRDPHLGRWFPFVQAKTLPSWEKHEPGLSFRRFQGRTIRPPFVVVRRTSRPGDKFRAVGTIITGSRRVAVENHLLVVVPHDRTVRGCKAVMSVLKQDATSKWLDARIRCRHLTVSSLIDLPWREPADE